MERYKVNLWAVILLIAVVANGQERETKTLGDTRWTDASSNEHSVSCYWMSQFSDTVGASNQNVLVVLPSAKYAGNEARIEAYLDDMLDGIEAIDAGTIARWNTAMGDGDLKILIVDDPASALSRMGLSPPDDEISP